MRLVIEDGKIEFNGEPLIEHINFNINDNSKVALIGKNGCGKTSLLKVIEGEWDLVFDNSNSLGYITRSNDFSLGYLKTIDVNGIKVTFTHGHIYNRNNLPENCGNIFLSGHTHVGMIEQIGERIIANPGSISKPRGGTKKSYIIIDEEKIELKTLEGESIKNIRIDNEFSA